MPIATESLLADLLRLERSLGRMPGANDVIREGSYSANTYYKRFGGRWSAVVEAYEDWRESGDLPVEAESFDWRSLQGAASTERR